MLRLNISQLYAKNKILRSIQIGYHSYLTRTQSNYAGENWTADVRKYYQSRGDSFENLARTQANVNIGGDGELEIRNRKYRKANEVANVSNFLKVETSACRFSKKQPKKKNVRSLFLLPRW